MDRIVKYLIIIVILISNVILIVSATHSSVLINIFIIGIGVLSIVTVLWYLVETLSQRTYKIGKIFTSQNMMKVLFVILIIMACGFYMLSKIDSWKASQIEKARLQQNPALIENH